MNLACKAAKIKTLIKNSPNSINYNRRGYGENLMLKSCCREKQSQDSTIHFPKNIKYQKRDEIKFRLKIITAGAIKYSMYNHCSTWINLFVPDLKHQSLGECVL